MRTYGYTPDDVTALPSGAVAPGVQLTVWDAPTAGAQVLDLLDADEAPLPGYVLSGADGAYGWKHDGTFDYLYASADAGVTRWAVQAHEALTGKLDTAAANATYGRKVSLVVDAAGGGDYSTLTAALAAVPAGGADVLIKRGTYTGAFVVPSNVTLRGEGDGTIIKAPNGASLNPLSTANNSANVTIANLKVDGNRANNTLAAFSTLVVNGSATTVRNCHVVNSPGYGIVTYGQPGTNGNDVLFEGNIVEDCAKEGLEFQGTSRSAIVGNLVKRSGYQGILVWANTAQGGVSKDVTISGNVVTDSGQTVTQTGIRVDDGAENVTITGNTVSGGGGTSDGITIQSQTAATIKGVTVTGNTVRATPGKGITVSPSAAGTVVAANTVRGTGNNGIYFAGTGGAVSANVVESCGGTTNDGVNVDTAPAVTVTGNRVLSSGAAGIILRSCKEFTVTGNVSALNRTGGVYLLDSNDGAVTGNTCRANGQAGVGSVVSNGITLFKNTGTCSGVIVSGNRCYDDQGTKTQAYGLRLYGAVTGCNLGPNLLTGNATADQLVDAAATNIKQVIPA